MSRPPSSIHGQRDAGARRERADARVRVSAAPLLARVRAMLGARARRRADSLDFVQEAWAEFLASPAADASIDEGELVRRLGAIARNNVRDAGRRMGAAGFESVLGAGAQAEHQPDDDVSPASVAARADELERLARATESLPEDLKQIVRLHIEQDLGFAEIARRLERNEDTVRKAYYRVVVSLSRRVAR